MKGIELPVNVLVIVAIAVIVLVALIVITGIATGQATWFSKEAELNAGCNNFRQVYGQFCEADPSSISISENRTTVRNLQELCNIHRGCGKLTDLTSGAVACCKRSCQCREAPVEAAAATTTT